MNKVFKVIWSDARSAYVVVSEMAKSHGTKSCSTKKLLAMLLATGVMTCASMAPAMAANPALADTRIEVGKDANAKGGDSVAIGNGAEAKGANGVAIGYKSLNGDNGWGVAVGGNTQATGTFSVALGQTAKATNVEGIAIGYTSLSEGSGAIAIGKSTNAKGTASLAFGNDAKALEEASIAFGQRSNSNGKASIAVGRLAKATGENSIAIGNQSVAAKDNSVVIGAHTYNKTTGTGVTGVGQQTQVLGDYAGAFGMAASANKTFANAIGSYAKATADCANAFGSNSTASAAWSVALGTNSVADRTSGYVGLYAPKDTNSRTWIANGGAVSVGSNGTLTRQITNVAAGAEDTDAVNVAQLKAATENAGWNLSTGKEITNPTKVKSGDYVDFNGDQNVSVSKDAKDGVKTVKVELNKDLKDIESISNDGASLTLNGTATELTNGKGAAITLFGDTTTINNKVTVYNDGRIAGVAAGVADTDAVNVSQLKAVGTTANMGWNLATNGVATEATNVKPGDFVDFSGDKNISVSHDGTKVQVELNKDIDVNSVQTNALNSKYNLSVGTANENGIMPFFVNSTGDFYAAHNKFHVDKDGKVTATAGEIGNVVLQNGVYTGHSALRDGELFVGDASGNYSQITTKGAKLGKVTVAEDGKISGVAAGAVTADSTDAVNGSQLHAVATEAGKHSKVVNGSNINVEEFDNDGQKIYKVNLNKDIMLGDLTGKYVNISGTNGTIETTGYIATKDRVYADKGGKLADIDVTGDKISNGASSIVLDGSNVKVNDKVTIDQNGKISGVAAGEISSTSTDAINGSQLHQTNENVAANRADIDKNKADIAALDNRVTKNEADIAANRADIDKNKADIAANRTDIDKNAADIAQNKTDIKNLDNRVTNVEELAKKHTTVTQGDNITVTEGLNADGGKEYNVALDKDINLDSVTTGQTVMNNDGLKVGKDVSVTATAVTAGQTSISNDGLKVNGKTYVSDNGLNANDQKVTNVAAGELSATSKDAVNGSQLYQTNQEVANNTNRINKLGSRVNKVGAGAAALAALHPLDFDPDAKWDFAAGYGNYNGENAAAIGAYYRPNEDTMFSVGGSFGNGENMVNAGVSFKLGSGSSHVSTSRVAMAKEIKELREHMAAQDKLIAQLTGPVNALTGSHIQADLNTLFPDVPKNHWAYDYVTKLAQEGYIEGYPDGNFKGDAMMTRYEFAAVIYRAMMNGAARDAKLGGDENLNKLLKEFEPELEYIRIDTIAKDKAGNPTIQRVRTVKANTNK